MVITHTKIKDFTSMLENAFKLILIQQNKNTRKYTTKKTVSLRYTSFLFSFKYLKASFNVFQKIKRVLS